MQAPLKIINSDQHYYVYFKIKMIQAEAENKIAVQTQIYIEK